MGKFARKENNSEQNQWLTMAIINWPMITKKVPYKPPTQYLFLDQKRKLRMVNRIKRNIAKFDIKPEDVGFNNLLNIST